jgi:sarcosine oxidase, subunit beta
MHTDFVIIGAGVYGAATAWHLARAGASVVVLDERDIATRASGGPGRRGVRANGRDLRELALMPEAYALWPSLAEELGAAEFYQRCGHLLLAETDIHASALQARAWMQRARGVATEFLSGDAAREREPGLSKAVRAALHCPDDGVADHSATTRAYARAAKSRGVEFRTFTKALSIDAANARARAVITTSGEEFVAGEAVLVLANSKVAALLSPWQTLPVWSECLQVLVSAPLEQVPFRHLTGHAGRTISLKTEGAERVMISGGWHGHWDPVTEDGVAIDSAIAGNLAEAIAVYPELEGLQIDLADASHLETFTPDAIPIIDQLQALPNVWFATGWCGHGWAIAPVVAEKLAAWVLHGSCAQELEPLRLARFYT